MRKCFFKKVLVNFICGEVREIPTKNVFADLHPLRNAAIAIRFAEKTRVNPKAIERIMFKAILSVVVCYTAVL